MVESTYEQNPFGSDSKGKVSKVMYEAVGVAEFDHVPESYQSENDLRNTGIDSMKP